jgi:ABC-2 type transport system ATP-binding protein
MKQAQAVRENVGIIFQQPSLDPQLTVEENIRFHACLYGVYGYHPSFKMMPKAYRERVMELAGMEPENPRRFILCCDPPVLRKEKM